METKFSYTRQIPQEDANIFNRLCFGWSREIFTKGAKRDLTLSDLYQPLTVDGSKKLSDTLEEKWEDEIRKWKQKQKEMGHQEDWEKKGEKPRLERALLRAFWKDYLITGILSCFQYACLGVIIPLMSSAVIKYFNTNDDTKQISQSEVLCYAAYLIICELLVIFVMHHCDMRSQQTGMRLRVACCSLIYRKILRLSRAAFFKVSAGQVVNLLSNDVSRFDELCFYLNFVWITPIQIIIILAVTYQKVGVASLIGVSVLLLMTLPTNAVFISLAHTLRGMIASSTDRRVQFMNELISGIQVIKMYAWEKPFQKILTFIRSSEIRNIGYSLYMRALYLSFVVFTTRVVLFLTILSFILLGNKPRAELTFMLATYFEMIQLTATLFFPQALLLLGETLVSIERIQAFLLLEEKFNVEPVSDKARQNGVLKFKKKKIEKENVESIRMTNGNEGSKLECNEKYTPVSIELQRVSANWIPGQLPPTLCNMSMTIRSGELCVLVGPVGSGKSSILQLLLNELPVGAGSLQFKRNDLGCTIDPSNLRISYASQEAWLFSGTIRENILFGQPYDKDRYMAVTRACALIRDFQQFPYGDMSHAGEGGSSLSGGQRARVNLARAVYRQADIYLFDDPLSAVDPRVAKHLFNKCIKNYLRDRTRIMVTHQLQFVKDTDQIVVVDQGVIKMRGTYDELSRSEEDFVEMMDRIKSSTEAKRASECVEAENEKRLSRKSLGRASIKSTSSSVASYNYENNALAPENEEAMGQGGLSYKVYQKYFQFGGSTFILFLLLVVIVVSQTATSGNDYWLSYWTNLEIIRSTLDNNTRSYKPQYASYILNGTFLSNVFSLDQHGLISKSNGLYVYGFCILACIIGVSARNMFFMKICLNATKNLHHSMFTNILRTTMSFYHKNPSGRILNRFSKDVGAVDELLPKVILETVQIFMVIVGVLIMIVVMNVWMLIPLSVLLAYFFVMRVVFIRTTHSIKRLEGVAKSPVFSHVNATLNGLVTIRSSGAETMTLLKDQFDDLQDVHTGAWYMTIVTPVVFGLYLDIAVVLFLLFLCFSFILTYNENTLGGNVGLAISQALIIVGTLQHGVKQSGEVLAHITSVERMLQYTDLPKEAPWTSNNPPPADWPKKGQLSLKNVSMTYEANEPPVLKNLNVTLEPGWKVGVVGRTGAGKSSLISALFRLFDDGLEGEIKIDDVNTKTIGLHELRSRISIIPQQPFLFSESLRSNLDPFNEYEDAALWDSLRQVELNEIVLDQKVLQSGSNLSIGQRQLICLARAVLKNNRILVLDEATANIDSHTDELIQSTIRTRFDDCTVITIAHRLHTIIDSDRIIVMDAGRIVEFGCPYDLLRNESTGIFSQMVKNMGTQMAESLREQAEAACSKHRKHRSVDLSRRDSSEDVTVRSAL
ncbi:multidrug resistance-associated protein 4-like [Ceratina calcarata]|uniref:Multidrug resistance-associated protein 4-like n=1 Tax=Ceratina calcarata TaxID=156304 RepID=A0AAJ7NE03_9HYME|nr:multidrug resistance-associated protein 4-like [Ceratina calcarata]